MNNEPQPVRFLIPRVAHCCGGSIRLFHYLRIHLKLWLRKYFLIHMFCKKCGRTVTDKYDFNVSDEEWHKIESKIKYGNILCYPCYLKLSNE